jgi:hypothetical protein
MRRLPALLALVPLTAVASDPGRTAIVAVLHPAAHAEEGRDASAEAWTFTATKPA